MTTVRNESQIHCDHDGALMAEVKDGHLILRAKHDGVTHIKVVALADLEPPPPNWDEGKRV